ncbi:MAG: cation diffusion facilitator family transporter [Gemmatimonadota bacterium]|nr:cation diffusion facilitator family transporter [Gemmatimonadota bacterium]
MMPGPDGPLNGDTAVPAADCAHTGQLGGHSRALGLALGITATFMVAEVVGGWLANSLALLADAGHMLADVASLALALFAARLAQRPATPGRTYGFLRLEIFAAAINGALLLGIAGLIIWRALARLADPPHVATGLMLAVATAGFVANLVTLRLLHDGHGHSLNVRGAYLHVLGDLLGSVGAIGAGIVMAFTGWTAADAIASGLIALLVAVSALRLLRDSVDVLLEATPRHISLAAVARELDTIPGVSDVHDLHVWTVTSGVIAMTGHAVVTEVERSPDVLAAAADRMRRLGIEHVTVQLEAARCE